MQRRLYGPYRDASGFETEWRDLVDRLGGRERAVGRSVEGRSLWRFDLGVDSADAPTILLTALIHGVEVIGSVALRRVVAEIALGGLLDEARVVVMPIANPDALAANMERLERGRIAFQRRNANGVDLNRNFPPVGGRKLWHPFSGSARRWSPYYRGPAPLSEPESRAIAGVALEVRPALSLGFHSFGNLLLFPWAWTRDRNPRWSRYQGLGQAFARPMSGMSSYRCRQAIDLYPTVGDLDDWLDARLGTLAFTVEVGGLDRRLLHPLRFVNPFCWMNPTRVEATVGTVAAGAVGMMTAAVT